MEPTEFVLKNVQREPRPRSKFRRRYSMSNPPSYTPDPGGGLTDGESMWMEEMGSQVEPY